MKWKKVGPRSQNNFSKILIIWHFTERNAIDSGFNLYLTTFYLGPRTLHVITVASEAFESVWIHVTLAAWNSVLSRSFLRVRGHWEEAAHEPGSTQICQQQYLCLLNPRTMTSQWQWCLAYFLLSYGCWGSQSQKVMATQKVGDNWRVGGVSNNVAGWDWRTVG